MPLNPKGKIAVTSRQYDRDNALKWGVYVIGRETPMRVYARSDKPTSAENWARDEYCDKDFLVARFDEEHEASNFIARAISSAAEEWAEVARQRLIVEAAGSAMYAAEKAARAKVKMFLQGDAK